LKIYWILLKTVIEQVKVVENMCKTLNSDSVDETYDR